jgi:DNA-binding response OmpR family regulator
MKTNQQENILQVLFIEDDPFLSGLLHNHFLENGIPVVIMSDAEKALAWLSENRPDLILLDLVLPGMSGYDFLVKVKKDIKLSPIPVIVLSNLSQTSEIERVIVVGAESFIVKAQASLDEIFNIVKKRLNK